MLSKLFNFLLVYILSIINFLIILLPLTFVFCGKYFLLDSLNEHYTKSILLLIISLISFLMLVFLTFDFLFSFSVRKHAISCIKITKEEKYKIFINIFSNIKDRFNKQNIELYIQNNSDINAYAVGSLGKNIIVLTTGLLNLYKANSKNMEEFLTYIKCILGHEMSHIVNKDYFPALLLIVNERALNFVSNIVFFIVNILISLVNIIPIFGNYLAIALVNLYKIFSFIVHFFYNYIMLKIYNLINLQISRNIEYRADKDGAMICGGKNMADTLLLLGESGYFTIFSTHPSTKKRADYVKNIECKSEINPVFLSNIIIIISLFLLIFLFVYCYKEANIKSFRCNYISMKYFFENKIIYFKYRLKLFLGQK